MKRYVPLMTAIVFSAATALTAQEAKPAPQGTRPAPQTAKPQGGPPATHEAHTAASGADLEFAKKIAAGGHAEVELAKLAQQKASAAEVKSLASRLDTDHSKANDELMRIASQKGWTLPAEPTPDQKNTKARLEKLSGAAFDKEYTTLMVTNHKNNIPVFEREASKGADNDVKQFASSVLPTLKEHLEMAQKAQKAASGSSPQSKR
jgi:putative membrane protein